MITCHKFYFCGLVNKTSIFRLSLNHPSSALSLDVIVGCLLGKYDKFHQHLHQNNDVQLYHVYPSRVSMEFPDIESIILYLLLYPNSLYFNLSQSVSYRYCLISSYHFHSLENHQSMIFRKSEDIFYLKIPVLALAYGKQSTYHT